jgi:hypothetical protein
LQRRPFPSQPCLSMIYPEACVSCFGFRVGGCLNTTRKLPTKSDRLVINYRRWLAEVVHPGDNPGANLKSISHRCYLRKVAFEWKLTKETIYLPLGHLQGGGSLQGFSSPPGPGLSMIYSRAPSDPKLETRTPKPRTRNTKYETRNTKLET